MQLSLQSKNVQCNCNLRIMKLIFYLIYIIFAIYNNKKTLCREEQLRRIEVSQCILHVKVVYNGKIVGRTDKRYELSFLFLQ